jgi:hypothetical protein
MIANDIAIPNRIVCFNLRMVLPLDRYGAHFLRGESSPCDAEHDIIWRERSCGCPGEAFPGRAHTPHANLPGTTTMLRNQPRGWDLCRLLAATLLLVALPANGIFLKDAVASDPSIEQRRVDLSESTRQKCFTTLRGGLHSELIGLIRV